MLYFRIIIDTMLCSAKNVILTFSLMVQLALFSLFPISSLTAAERPIFDGETLNGWTFNNGRPITHGWEVKDGMIHLVPSQKDSNELRAGNILTVTEYQNFDLSFEWKISEGGNSGLKYRVRDYDGGTYGIEYQICDDVSYPKQLTPRTSTGALYDLYEPNQEKHLMPVGQFNKSRIVVEDKRIQHWLNGRLIVQATVGSSEWNNRLSCSKFADVKEFGQNPKGRIMLTDHGSEVWYRNFKLVESSSDPELP